MKVGYPNMEDDIRDAQAGDIGWNEIHLESMMKTWHLLEVPVETLRKILQETDALHFGPDIYEKIHSDIDETVYKLEKYATITFITQDDLLYVAASHAY